MSWMFLLVPAQIKELRLYENGNCLRYVISGTPNYTIIWYYDSQPISQGTYMVC